MTLQANLLSPQLLRKGAFVVPQVLIRPLVASFERYVGETTVRYLLETQGECLLQRQVVTCLQRT